MLKPLDIQEQLKMSMDLWEKHSDSWHSMSPENGKLFMLYMIEEMGEAISIIKKKGEDEIMANPDVRSRFVEELCDIMMYYSDVLNRFNITGDELSSKYREKFNRNIQRDYKEDHENS